MRCPRCSSPVGPDQDWCLECGAPARTRLAPTPNWQLPTVAIGAVVALAGALLALAGAAVVFRDQLSLAIPAAAMAAVLLASLADAGAATAIKRFPRGQPLAMNAVAMTVGAVFLLAGSTIAGEPRVIPQRLETWLALVWLVGATIAGFVLLVWVLGRWSVSATAYVRVLSPLVTVLLATTIAGESLTSAFLVGGALVIAGVYIGALSRPSAPAVDPVPEP